MPSLESLIANAPNLRQTLAEVGAERDKLASQLAPLDKKCKELESQLMQVDAAVRTPAAPAVGGTVQPELATDRRVQAIGSGEVPRFVSGAPNAGCILRDVAD